MTAAVHAHIDTLGCVEALGARYMYCTENSAPTKTTLQHVSITYTPVRKAEERRKEKKDKKQQQGTEGRKLEETRPSMLVTSTHILVVDHLH